MAITRDFNNELEMRRRLRVALVAGAALEVDDQGTLIDSLAGESSYSFQALLEKTELRSYGAQTFAIGLALSGGSFDRDSDTNFARVVNEAWSAVLATLLWAGAHGAKLPLDQESRQRLEREVGQPIPPEVTDYSSYLKWAGAAAGLGAVLLARSGNPYLRAAALLLGGAAPLLEEKAAEGQITSTIVVPGPSPDERARAAATIGAGSQSGVAVIRKPGVGQ